MAFCRRHGLSRSRFYEIRAQARGHDTVTAVATALTPARRSRPDLATSAVEALALQVRKELAEQGWDHGPISVLARLRELAVQGRDEGLFTNAAIPSRATLAGSGLTSMRSSRVHDLDVPGGRVPGADGRQS